MLTAAFFALVTFSHSAFSRWANPDDGRKPRQRRRGIVHGLRRALVCLAAWWIERVVFPAGAAVEAVVFSWGPRWYSLARWSESAVHWLLFAWLAFRIAGRHLRWKWGQS